MRTIVFLLFILSHLTIWGQQINYDTYKFINGDKSVKHSNIRSSVTITDKSIKFVTVQKGKEIKMDFSIIDTNTWYPETGWTQIEYKVRYNGPGGDLGSMTLVLLRPKNNLRESVFSIVQGDRTQMVYYNEI